MPARKLAWGLFAAASWLLAAGTTGRVGILFATAFSGTRAPWSAANVLLSLTYTVPVLAIVALHELGHFVACREVGVRTRFPIAVPLPLGLVQWLHLPVIGAIGLAGAVLPLRDRFANKEDVWRATLRGVLYGLAATAVCTALGLAFSTWTTLPSRPMRPWLPGLLQAIPMPNRWHPLLSAAWVGWALTAASLIPIPPLDGGRLLFALPSVWRTRTREVCVLLLVGVLCLA